MKPILFEFGGFALPSYLALLVGGAFLFFWLSTRAAERRGLPGHRIALLLALLYGAGLVGARLLFVVEHHWLYANPRQVIFSVAPGAFASHGAFLLAAPVAILGAYWLRVPLRELADSTALGLCVFGALARTGCFLGGCCYGRPTSLLWGTVYPEKSEAAARWGFGTAVHPAQLYEAAALLGIALLLLFFGRRYRSAGKKFLWLALAYSVARFLIEFARGDALVEYWSLSLPQWFSLGVIGLSLGSLLYARGFPRAVAQRKGNSLASAEV